MLTTAQGAKRLGITVIGVRKLIERGRLPAKMLGRDWLVEEKDLALVKDRKRGRPPASKAPPKRPPPRKSNA